MDLGNVTGIETYTFDGNMTVGSRDTADVDADAHTLTFQGGNVGTVTDIAVDGSMVTDGRDSLKVLIDGVDNGGAGTTVDVDYRFTIDGTAGDDRLEKANAGLANQIEFNGGEGSDTVAINDGDLGATTTIDGGSGTDWLSQTGGTWTDDDFINVTSVEGLTAESPLVATLGASADAAGVNQIVGTGPGENITIDAAFDNDLDVNLAQGGNDTFDASASSSVVTFVYEDGATDLNGNINDIATLDAGDTLSGGTSEDDVLNLIFEDGGESVDLANVSGVETINVGETGGHPTPTRSTSATWPPTRPTTPSPSTRAR